MRLSTMPLGLTIPRSEESILNRTDQLVPISHDSYGINAILWKVILIFQHIIREELEDKCAEVFLPWPNAVTDVFDCEKAYPTETEIAMRFMENIMSTHQALPQRIFQFKHVLREIAPVFSSIPSNVSQIFEAYSFSDSEADLHLQKEIIKEALLRVLLKTELPIVIVPEPGKPKESIMCIYTYGNESILYNRSLNVGFRLKTFEQENPHEFLKRHNIDADARTFRPTFATKIGELYTPGQVSIRSSFMRDENVFSDSPYFMGRYELDLTRLLDCVIAKKYYKRGVIWPDSIAPFEYHIIAIPEKSSEAERIYTALHQSGIKVIWDDRDVPYRDKLSFAWLIGGNNLIILDNTWDKDGNRFKVSERSIHGVLLCLSVEKIIEAHNK